jgi:hypothetical protein
MRKLFMLSLALAGCTPGVSGVDVASQFIPTTARRAPTALDHVQLFLSDAPAIPRHELGIVEVFQAATSEYEYRYSDGRMASPLANALAQLRVQGAASGCDGVIANPPELTRFGWHVTGTCIAYDQPTVAVQPPQ